MTDCKCGRLFEMQENFVYRDMGNGVYSGGLQCPYCHRYTHSLFEDDSARKLKQDVQDAAAALEINNSYDLRERYVQKRKKLNAVYDKAQEKYKHLLAEVINE